MSRSKSARRRKKGAARGEGGRATRRNRTAAKRAVSRQRRGSGRLISRVPTVGAGRGPVAKAATAAPTAPPSPVPEATLNRAGGPVTVEIAFGQAQHGSYTIQLFDPSGTTELTREEGLSTDDIPDRFEVKLTASQLDQHLLQWSGAVDAFNPGPGQQYSVIFDVSQKGRVVPGGHLEKTGPLTITQAFLGILRLVAP